MPLIQRRSAQRGVLIRCPRHFAKPGFQLEALGVDGARGAPHDVEQQRKHPRTDRRVYNPRHWLRSRQVVLQLGGELLGV
jgi:hypothetical protein